MLYLDHIWSKLCNSLSTQILLQSKSDSLFVTFFYIIIRFVYKERVTWNKILRIIKQVKMKMTGLGNKTCLKQMKQCIFFGKWHKIRGWIKFLKNEQKSTDSTSERFIVSKQRLSLQLWYVHHYSLECITKGQLYVA